MADELQALLSRITEEGLKKAEEERRGIVEKANAEGRRLVAEAKAEAEAIVEAGRREAALLRETGEQSLRQAARDVLLSLRRQLEQRVTEVAGALAGKALDATAMAGLVADLARHFVEAESSPQRLEVLLNPDQAKALEQALAHALSADLRARVELSPVPTVKTGFRLRVSGTEVVYDFSDEALAEALATFLSPKLAAIFAAAGT